VTGLIVIHLDYEGIVLFYPLHVFLTPASQHQLSKDALLSQLRARYALVFSCLSSLIPVQLSTILAVLRLH
jgi:hypothetical protein